MENVSRRLVALVSLCRVQNCFLAGFATWVGAFTSGAGRMGHLLAFACLATMLVAASGNASNDIADRNIDREGKPDRALACGAVAPGAAWAWSILLGGGGIFLGFLVGPLHGSVAICVAAMLLAYNFFLKRVPFLGNLVVALLSALPFVYGGLLSRDWQWSLIPFVFAALVHLAREIVKSVEDVEDDTRHGVRTIAAYVDSRKLRGIAAAFFLAVMGGCIVPFALGWYNRVYLLIVMVGVFLPKSYAVYVLMRPNWRERLGLVHQFIKIEMLAGSVAILLARGIPPG